MINRNLRNAVKRAYDISNRLSVAIQKVETFIVYEGFDDDVEPNASITSSGELILEWRGHEIHIDSVITIMEHNGCITPHDFDVLWGTRW